ncbi:MAG: presenilin family intramembrane aspartyl protease [Candidatus Nanoarchaeia archaeon]
MKHNWKITILLLSMFIVTQLIGLYVINYYSPVQVVNHIEQNTTAPPLPFGLEPPAVPQQANFWETYFPSIIFAFIIAISLFFILTKFRAEFVLRAWFFIVIVIALSVTLISFFPNSLVFIIGSLIVSIVLSYFKIYRQNFLIHNITELFIYPGIAAIFVALLSSPTSPDQGIYAAIILLVLISLYDMWAVWHSGVMQKMAKYQINNLKIFGGFFVPYISKRLRLKLKKLNKSGKKNKKLKVNIALLGGGDIFYPIVVAGVVLRKFGFMTIMGLQVPLASILIILGATLGLGYLFLFSEKKKFYPAMPFISAGILVALGICYLFL